LDWFTADTHYEHYNIIRHCDRPFASVQEMDEALLDGTNSLVAPSDTLYHLGDFARYHRRIAAYRERIRCRNIVLILGNHDPQDREGQPKEMLRGIFSRVFVELRIRPNIGGVRRPITLNHNAMRTWDGSHRGSWHLFGHSHGKLPNNMPTSLDVGVDAHNYLPVSLPQITRIIQEAEHECGK